MSLNNNKVGIGAYIALLFAIIFFSGVTTSNLAKEKIFTTPKSQKIASVMDFNTLNGKFGTVLLSAVMTDDNSLKTKNGNFSGTDGLGARHGFMFALTLVPTVMFALGMVAILEYFGALDAMRQILSLILRPIMGVPGEGGLAMIAGLQSTDAGAAMTRQLYDEGKLTEDEKEIFSMFQFSAGAPVSNFLSSGAALLALSSATGDTVPTSLGVCFAVIFLMKFVGANIFRFYIYFTNKKQSVK